VDFQSQHRVPSIAAPWLNHRATLFNQPDFRLGAVIDWRKDYRTGVTAPLKFSPFINHRDSRVAGDVKYIWELNRLQHLAPLLLAGVWTEREAYRKEVERQIESWRQANPFMLGVTPGLLAWRLFARTRTPTRSVSG